jgi:hypothetical protein
MIDLVHAAQRGPHAAFIVQANDRHFDGHPARQARGLRRGAQQNPDLLARLRKMPDEGPSYKSGGTGN